MKKVLISACLLGLRCRYDGKSKPMKFEKIEELKKKYILIPVCPEQLGGLPTPRLPSEIVGEKVIRQDGIDVTEFFIKGAKETLYIAKLLEVDMVIFKDKSPSCGVNWIYDGTFSGRLKKGCGITTRLLKKKYKVISEKEL